MGKIRRSRTKFHASTGNKTAELSSHEPEKDALENKIFPSLALPPLSENPFSNISISHSDLKQKLDLNNNELPEASISSEEKEKPKAHLNKKEKRKLRRENFLKKLNAAKAVMEGKKAAKKRASVPVVGDLQPLTLALPTIESIIGEKDTEVRSMGKKKRRRKPRRLKGSLVAKDPEESFKKLDEKGRRKLRSKRTQKHMLHEIHRFQKLLSDPSFKKNSIKLVTEMIQDNAKKMAADT